MKLLKLLKEIKGVFKPPVKKYYLGRIVHGTPYFHPWNFVGSIIKLRKLKFKSQEKIDKYVLDYPHLVKHNDNYKFNNLPMVRRAYDKIVKLFGNYYWVQIGYPIKIHIGGLGWKDKYESPRFEWSPSFQVYFFKWQFCIYWNSPCGDNDKYYEQILWYLHYTDKDIEKARKTWSWVNYETKVSTWSDEYLIKNFKV